jgi:hypothetical protein
MASNLSCLVALSWIFVLTACSSTAKGPPAATEGGAYDLCQAYMPDADLSMPASFGADVAPVFQRNCTSGGAMCHGTQGNAPYLGEADAGVDAQIILARIVSVKSDEDPSMQLVAPADPANSYLMHKLDHDQCILAAECAVSTFGRYYPTCGANMPLQMPQLPAATRDAIRAWIEQGATNN